MNPARTGPDAQAGTSATADRLARRDLVLIGLQAGRRSGPRRPRAGAPRSPGGAEPPRSRVIHPGDASAAGRR